jgi:hypothetical protein
MKIPLKVTLLSASLMALMLPVVAQTTSAPAPSGSAAPPQTTAPSNPPSTGTAAPPSTTAPATPPSTGTAAPPSTTSPAKAPESINQHKQNQQRRISQSVDDGRLTAGQASTLEKQESNINQEEKTMKSEDNGHLTGADRTALRQQQDQMSNEITHDDHTVHQNMDPKSQEGKRALNQQQRIAAGEKSGNLTAGQASHLEGQENAINKEVAQDRQANGGHMTQQEKNQVNQQQNKLSKQIHKDKTSKKK